MEVLTKGNSFIINGQEYLSGDPVEGLWVFQKEQFILLIKLKDKWTFYYNVDAEISFPKNIKTEKIERKYGKGALFQIKGQEFETYEQANGVFILDEIALIFSKGNYLIFYPDFSIKVTKVNNYLEDLPLPVLELILPKLNFNDLVNYYSIVKGFISKDNDNLIKKNLKEGFKDLSLNELKQIKIELGLDELVNEEIKRKLEDNELIKLLNTFPDKEWDWYALSRNPNITWNIVEANPNKPWDWDGLSQNLNIYLGYCSN